MPDYNLDAPTFLRVAAIFLLGLTSAPFLVALALWLSTKLLRFKNPSYTMSLVSILTALAATAVVEALLFQVGVTSRHQHVLRESWIALAMALGTSLVAGAISVAKLFNESVWKSLAATALQLMSGVLVGAVVVGAMVYTAVSHIRPVQYAVREIRVVPIGAVAPEETDAVLEIIRQEFPGLRATTGDPMDLPALAFNRARRQYDAGMLLSELLVPPGDPQSRMVGVTDVDLFNPGLHFVFSTAQQGGRAAVMSVFRLHDSDEKVSRERYRKIVMRTLGLTFGFKGSRDSACVMASSDSLQELDAQGTAWCGREPALLRKILGAE